MGQFHVRTQAELNAALSKAEGGDTILLAPGARFDKIQLYKKDFDATVTIASADPKKPATVLELNLNGTSNLNLEGIVFDHKGVQGQPFRVFNAENVAIRDSFFDGHIATSGATTAGYGSGLGLYVNHSTGIAVENNTFKSFNNASGIHNSQDVVMRGNEIIDIRNDGMTFSGLKGALIEGNDFHSPRSPDNAGLHRDGIQFWTANSTASEHVVIRGNTFHSTDDRQTIFISNEAARSSAPAKPHKDFLIENNVVKGVATHGISVEHGSGIIIRNNLLEPAHGAPDEVHRNTVPLINVSHSSANVTITGNTVADVQKEVRSSWTVENNELTTSKSFWHWSGSSSVPPVSEGPSDTYRAWLAETPPAVPVDEPAADIPPAAPSEPAVEKPAPAEPVAEKPAPAEPVVATPPPALPDAPVVDEPVVEEPVVADPAPADPVPQDPRLPADDEFDFVESGGRQFEFGRGDFAFGRTVTLDGFEADTFAAWGNRNELAVTDDGRAVEIDSVIDLVQMTSQSDAVSAQVMINRDLLMRVEQSGGVDEITFRDVGIAYQTLASLDLF